MGVAVHGEVHWCSVWRWLGDVAVGGSDRRRHHVRVLRRLVRALEWSSIEVEVINHLIVRRSRASTGEDWVRVGDGSGVEGVEGVEWLFVWCHCVAAWHASSNASRDGACIIPRSDGDSRTGRVVHAGSSRSLSRGQFGGSLVLALRTLVVPSMFLLLMLFAIALALSSELAELALIEKRILGVAVVDVTLTFLLGREALLVVLATRLRALEGTRMSLLVFGEVTLSGENLVASGVRALHLDVFGNVAFLSASHGSRDVFIESITACSLHSRGWYVRLTSPKGVPLAVLPANELSLITGLTEATFKSDLVVDRVRHVVVLFSSACLLSGT